MAWAPGAGRLRGRPARRPLARCSRPTSSPRRAVAGRRGRGGRGAGTDLRRPGGLGVGIGRTGAGRGPRRGYRDGEAAGYWRRGEELGLARRADRPVPRCGPYLRQEPWNQAARDRLIRFVVPLTGRASRARRPLRNLLADLETGRCAGRCQSGRTPRGETRTQASGHSLLRPLLDDQPPVSPPPGNAAHRPRKRQGSSPPEHPGMDGRKQVDGLTIPTDNQQEEILLIVLRIDSHAIP